MNKFKPFSCPKCGKKLPFKYTFTANNSSRIECKHCGAFCKLKTHLNIQLYIWIGFFPSYLIARFAMGYYDSLFIGGGIALLIMTPVIFIAAFYMYSTFEFTRE